MVLKYFILNIFIFTAISGKCQLTIETYGLDELLSDLEVNNESMHWNIGNAGTPDDYTDDYIEVTKFNELGQRTIQLGYRVSYAFVLDNIISYVVNPHNGDISLTISFWIHIEDSIPMVCYTYHDKYIFYQGNITY